MIEQKQVDILLVEDNPNDAELALRAFRKANLANQIVHVSDGAEALDFMYGRGQFAGRDTASHPRLILLDLKLPRVDGHEVLRILKADPALKVVPIVILTTSKEEVDLEGCYREGANSYLIKPVDFKKFVEAMRELGFYWLLLNELPGDHRT